MAKHKTFTVDTNVKVYFCDPQSERQILIQSDKGIYRFEDETFRDWVLGEQPARHP
jgi:hypothetical protein